MQVFMLQLYEMRLLSHKNFICTTWPVAFVFFTNIVFN